MRLVRIFARDEDDPPRGLLAVQYDEMGENENSWSRLNDNLDDIDFLENFFLEREHLLKDGYFGTIELPKAAVFIRQEMRHFSGLLEKADEGGIEHVINSLNQMFKPLKENEDRKPELLRSKAYGRKNKNWLRVYALKISDDLYVMTGGGIKLVHRIDDDETLKEERRKLGMVKAHLKALGMTDSDAFNDLEELEF